MIFGNPGYILFCLLVGLLACSLLTRSFTHSHAVLLSAAICYFLLDASTILKYVS
jgi:hypothetical protein